MTYVIKWYNSQVGTYKSWTKLSTLGEIIEIYEKKYS